MNLGKNDPADNLPCSFVIFGATGNLASNKLLPALYHLGAAARRGADRLPPESACSSAVFYLAIKPAEFGAVIQNLEAAGLNKPRGLHRVVIEKTFGENLESAQML